MIVVERDELFNGEQIRLVTKEEYDMEVIEIKKGKKNGSSEES